jgi:regulator of replication initiation timing
MQIPDFNSDTTAGLTASQILVQFVNIIEVIAAENAELRVENQHLRSELARLKGCSCKPDSTPSVKPVQHDHSSESEHQTRTLRGKPKKHQVLTFTYEERCVVDPMNLPPDTVVTRRMPSYHDCIWRLKWISAISVVGR